MSAPNTVALATVPNGGEMDTLTLGNIFVKSGYFADARDASQAIVKVLAGRELGFPPIASMTGIYIVKGKVSLSANLIAAAIKRSLRYTYRVREMTEERCSIEFFERAGDKLESIGTSTFTAQDARRAGTQNMDRFPRNMLFARAMSNGAKWFTPDIFGGPVYTPEELGAPVNEDGEVIDGEPRPVPPVIVQPPAPQPPASEPPVEQHDSTAAEFDATPNAREERAARDNPPRLPGVNGDDRPKRKLAIIQTPHFPAAAAKLAERVPYYRTANGKPDSGHILASALNLSYARITDDNLEDVFTALEQHAADVEAQRAAQPA